MSDFKRIIAISGGHEGDPSFAWESGVGEAEGYLVSFRPGEEIVFNDQFPVELIVEGYEGPEDESRPVRVQLQRMTGAVIWQAHVNRLNLASKPELVIR